MAGLKCEHCGHGIRYHGEPNGIELIMFSEAAWKSVVESTYDPLHEKIHDEYPVPCPYLYTTDTIYDDFRGFYCKIWKCPQCGTLHVFDNNDITRVIKVFIPCVDEVKDDRNAGDRFVIYDDMTWEQITELSIPNTEIERYYPPTFYALVAGNGLSLYADKNLTDCVAHYTEGALNDE